jgi:hypothetical protein
MEPHDPEQPRERRTALAAVRHEIATHPLVYSVMAAFCVIGPVLARMIFPEASLGLVLFGGIALGVVFTLCALAGRVLD